MKKTLSTMALAMVLAGSTFANGGIIVAGKGGSPCEAKDGIIVAGRDGIIVAGKDVIGIIVAGLTGVTVFGDTTNTGCTAAKDGIIVSD